MKTSEQFEALRKILEEENRRVDTTDAQRAANEHRLKMLRLLMGQKSEQSETKILNVTDERMKNPDFKFTPNYLLKDDSKNKSAEVEGNPRKGP